MESGVTATLLSSHTLSAQTDLHDEWIERGHKMRWVFTGTKQSVSVDLLRKKLLLNRLEPYPVGTAGTRAVFESTEDLSALGDHLFHDIAAMRLDFIRRCAVGEPPLQDIRDAWRTHLVCLAAEESALQEGRRIALNYGDA